ncbi:hypothetical protein CK203_103428 [Vitis vinifera]|uniref:Ubiquitin-like protease family profile domain-containing protein n=1 Tax=Vitis vinifera TaxID=29760 RepID=A0A438BQR7_VITVI|nr:hypothetical protein CK203_103428 [Vitis vinifera]
MFRIPIFKCDWVDNKNGIRVDDLGFTLVDFSKMAHKSNPFILASQAKEVFYVQDELHPRWSVFLSTPQQEFLERDEGDDLMDNSIEHHLIISSLPQVESFNAMDDSDAICMDLEQGEKPPTKRRCRGITRKSMIIKNRSRVASFTLDSKSMRNCMLTMGKCFRSFKNMLTVKYVIPFKNQSEDFREVQKERRNKHIYNHHLSGNGYVGLEDEMMAATGYIEIIDRSILWKKTMEKKDGTYDEVVIPVVDKIDKMLKESRESGRIFSGNNDIRTEALATLEYSGRVRKCQLAIGTKENVVVAGIIILECSVNFLVVVDASYEPNAPLPVPIPNQITTIGESLGHLHKKMVDAKMAGRFAFVNPALVSKVGMGEASKESRSKVIANRLMNANHADFIFIPYNPGYHWVLVALETRTMIAYYLDSLQNQPSDDLKEIVNMALRIHPPQKHKSSKREPTWVVVGCPIQPSSVECGYYVMRYMRDIIVDQGCLTSKNVLVGSKGNMKISNFGHGVLPQHCELHRHPHKT